MRIAIAVLPNATDTFPGPYGHAPFFAIYDRKDGAWQRIELRDNPYKALEGGGKPRLMKQLLADCDLWVGAQFGHGPGHGHRHGPGHGPPAQRREVPRGLSVREVLALLEQDA